jgi:putative intracellular protease/amidase
MAGKKIVIISTSASSWKGAPTGLWLEEAASPYYAFQAAGLEVQLASIAGGPVPIDGSSMGPGLLTDECKKFLHDAAAVGALSHTTAVADIDFSKVDAIYLAGGHGTVVDFIDNKALKAAIELVYNAGKPVGAVCHGPLALPQCNKADGTPLVAGGAVTGFSNAEEAASGLTDAVPFLLESKLVEQGGKYESGGDWASHVAVAKNLITGQNPQSSVALAAALVAALA